MLWRDITKGDIMDNQTKDKTELIAELRLAFFESSYSTVEMFAKYSDL